MSSEGKSIRWIVIASVILVAYLGWGFMAGSYAENSHVGGVIVVSTRGSLSGGSMMLSAVFSFVATSVMELPNFFRVISWHFSNRIWLPIVFIILEVLVVAGGYGLKKLEEQLESPRNRRR